MSEGFVQLNRDYYSQDFFNTVNIHIFFCTSKYPLVVDVRVRNIFLSHLVFSFMCWIYF